LDGVTTTLRDRHPYRPANIHSIVSKESQDAVTVRFVDPDNPCAAYDAVSGVRESLIAERRKVDEPARVRDMNVQGPHFREVAFDFVLAGKG
jgi:catechol 1,2-dioxygenase